MNIFPYFSTFSSNVFSFEKGILVRVVESKILTQ